jgi:hypothetical protein
MPAIDLDMVKLLHSPYTRPAFRRGDLTECLARGCVVIITGRSYGRIPWVRCRTPGHRGGSGLLVDAELARAIRCESSAALCFWWGITQGVVTRWRKVLGVKGPAGTEGSRRLIRASARKATAALKEREWTAKERQDYRRRALDLDLGRHLKTGFHGPCWTPEQLALLGTLPDAQVAKRIGRTVTAVRVMRTRRGIPSAKDRRRGDC